MSVATPMGRASTSPGVGTAVVSLRPSLAATGPVTSLVASVRPARPGAELCGVEAGLSAGDGAGDAMDAWVAAGWTKSAGRRVWPLVRGPLEEHAVSRAAMVTTAPARASASAGFVRPSIVRPATLESAVVFRTFVLLFGFLSHVRAAMNGTTARVAPTNARSFHAPGR
jgi:hypothetical protein